MRRWIALITLLVLLPLSPRLGATEPAESGPELKFDNPESTTTTPEKKPPVKYGDKPLVEVGNENYNFKLGGYGSFRFEWDSGQDLNTTFTLRRLVLTTDALLARVFRIYSELEFERFRKVEFASTTQPHEGGIAITQEIEGVNDSEISLEQIWFQLEFTDYIRFQGGGVLVPLGRFNINHDDNYWNLPRRSLIDRGVPILAATSAWDELGLGLNGEVALGSKGKFDYRIYVVNGATLNFQLEQSAITQTPDRAEVEFEGEVNISTGTFSQDVKDAKAVTGRVAFSPALGQEIGVSGYWGRYTPDFLIGKNLTSFGFDFLSTVKAFEVEGEFIYSQFGGLEAVLTDFAAQAGNTATEVDPADSPALNTTVEIAPSGLVDKKYGYWVELRYRFRPAGLKNGWFGQHFSDPQLIPVVRWEQAFLNGLVTDFQAVNGMVTVLDQQNRFVDRITAGLAFRLNPLAVFQLAYEYTWTNSGQSLATVTNFLPTPSSTNHSIMFGTAFGF